jgi:hypothetical protein
LERMFLITNKLLFPLLLLLLLPLSTRAHPGIGIIKDSISSVVLPNYLLPVLIGLGILVMIYFLFRKGMKRWRTQTGKLRSPKIRLPMRTMVLPSSTAMV